MNIINRQNNSAQITQFNCARYSQLGLVLESQKHLFLRKVNIDIILIITVHKI